MEFQSIESEMRDVIFCDPSFIDNFLTGDSSRLKSVLQHCHKSSVYNKQLRKWTIPRAKHESQLYQPALRIINTIKGAVDAATGKTHTVPFLDRSDHPIASDHTFKHPTKPDLVLFEGTHEHWETVRMPIEVKRLKTHLKVGVKNMSCYARGVFSHQLHRRRLRLSGSTALGFCTRSLSIFARTRIGSPRRLRLCL
jgi:hypothetical protein